MSASPNEGTRRPASTPALCMAEEREERGQKEVAWALERAPAAVVEAG